MYEFLVYNYYLHRHPNLERISSCLDTASQCRAICTTLNRVMNLLIICLYTFHRQQDTRPISTQLEEPYWVVYLEEWWEDQ